MKVALLKPDIGGILGLEMITFVEPLGLECVAGALEPEGHECRIFDLRIDGVEPGLAAARQFDPALIGLQCNFTTERYRALRLTRRVRREFPGAFILVGGHDASRDPSWFRDASVDAVAVGDGEEIVPALAEALETGSDPAAVPGLMLNTPDGTVYTGHAPARRDIDELPLPARHLIADYADQYYINFHKPLALMETARGCPFKCNFCSVWKFHESTFREKSPERVVEELRQIEARDIFITDDIFWMNVRRGRELARQIQAAGIQKWFKIQTRSDIICRFPDLIEMWKGCGKLSIFLGLESVTDEGLELVNKSNKAVNNERAMDILKELDVGYSPNFIVDPNWDIEDFERLHEWVERRGAYNTGYSILTPLPGTDLWNKVAGDVATRDWELYDIAHTVLPTKLPIEEFYEQYAKLWRKSLEVRYAVEGRSRVFLGLSAALLTGKVSMHSIRKGMNLVKRFSKPDTFLQGHRESAERLATAPAPDLPPETPAADEPLAVVG